MQRRHFLVAVGVSIAAPLLAKAQAPAKVRRIGILTLGVVPATPTMEAFRQGLREHGYCERALRRSVQLASDIDPRLADFQRGGAA